MNEKEYIDNEETLLKDFFETIPVEPMSDVLQQRIIQQATIQRSKIDAQNERIWLIATIVISLIIATILIGSLFYYNLLPISSGLKSNIDLNQIYIWVGIFSIAFVLLITESLFAHKYIKEK